MSTLDKDLQVLVARFEEGVSADPTQNMSPEDAAKWKAMNEEHRDKFKTAAYGDPYWMTAKYPGKAKDGTPIKKGDKVFYYPRTKTMLVGPEAEKASREFGAMSFDDDFGFRAAGFSVEMDNAWFAFVGNAPFNKDTIEAIRRVNDIPFKDDEGTLHDEGGVALRVMKNEYSGPLTYAQEKAGQVRENVVQVEFVKGMDKKKVLQALQEIGKKFKLKVEPMTGYKKPQTRGKKGSKEMSDLSFLATLDMELTASALPGAGIDKDAAAIEEIAKLAKLDHTANRMVAQTILDQMGGSRRLQVMLGVKMFNILATGNPGVGIQWPNKQRSKGNYVEIRLNGADLYDVKFFNRGGTAPMKLVKAYDDVYAEDLVNIFERQTGWYLRMASGQAHQLVQAHEAGDKTAGDRLFRFTEGTMTEKEWVQQYAVRLEAVKVSWQSLIDRRKYNRMDGDEQEKYEASLKKKAEIPQYRAWKDNDIFVVVSKETYLWAQKTGIGKKADLENGVLAEGCPDNLDESECAEWEANTEKYEDKFKTAGVTVKSIKPEDVKKADPTIIGTIDVDGTMVEVVRGPSGSLTTRGKGGKKVSPAESSAAIAAFKEEFPKTTWGRKKADLENGVLAEGCPDNLDESECAEWEANTEKYKDVVKDKAKTASTNYLLSVAPDGAAMVDGMVDEVLFSLVYARVMWLRFNQVAPLSFKILSVQGHRKTFREALEEMIQFNSGSQMYDIQPRGRNTYLVRNVNIAKSVLDDLSDEEEAEANARDFGLRAAGMPAAVNTFIQKAVASGQYKTWDGELDAKGILAAMAKNFKVNTEKNYDALMKMIDSAEAHGARHAYEEGSRVPDGWDNGQIEGKDKTDEPGEEGSDTPDGNGNQKKRAGKKPTPAEKAEAKKLFDKWRAEADGAEMDDLDESWQNFLDGDLSLKDLKANPPTKEASAKVAEVIEEMYALVTDDGYMLGATDDWHDARSKSYWRPFVDEDHVAEGKLMTLANVPLHLAEKFKDMGTSAQMFDDGYAAWAAARRFVKGPGTKLAAAEKEAATGLYGHTKRIQADCEGCVRKVQKSATQIARTVYARNAQVAEFLATHARRADSLPAKILVSALQGIGPKVASEIMAVENRESRLAELRMKQASSKSEAHKALMDRLASTDEVPLATIQGVHMAKLLEAAEDLQKQGFVTFDGVKVAKVTDADAQTGEGIKETTDKNASGAANAKYLASVSAQEKAKILATVAKHYGVTATEIEAEVTDADAENLYEYIGNDPGLQRSVHQGFQRMRLTAANWWDRGEQDFEFQMPDGKTLPFTGTLAEAQRDGKWERARVSVKGPGHGTWTVVKGPGKTAARTYGLYGFGEKVAKLGLQACTDLRHEAGKVAHDLHTRRAAHHAAINDFFGQHSKTAKCMYSKLLSASYPELKEAKTASSIPQTVQGWLEWDLG